MKRLIVPVLFLFFVPFAAAMPVHRLPNVAHRGASAAEPENTLAAFRQAVRFGADGAECDVWKTADNVLVILHDENLKRTTGFNGKVTEMTFAEVRQHTAGKDEKIPSLAEYLAVLERTHTKPVIEIKQNGITAEVIAQIRRSRMQRVSTIISFSKDTVKESRRLAPYIPAALLYSEDTRKMPGSVEDNADAIYERMTAAAKYCNTTILDVNHSLLSKRLVDKLRRSGITVWAWTADDPKRMHTLLDWGVVSITTNRPDELNKLRIERKRQTVSRSIQSNPVRLRSQ